LTADMMANKLFEKLLVIIGDKVIKADTRTYEHLFNLWQSAKLSKERQIIAMVNPCGRAKLGCHTFFIGAGAALCLTLAGVLSKVCGRTANIMNVSLKIGHIGYFFSLVNNRFMASAGNHSSLMIGERAEIAGAKATAVMYYRKFNLFDSGNSAKRLI